VRSIFALPMIRVKAMLVASALLVLAPHLHAEEPPEAETQSEADTGPVYGGPLLLRPKLTGDWGGVRDRLAAHGFTIDLDLTYAFQGVADGGLDGPLFDVFSDEDDTGHTFSGDLALELDTANAGLWEGGFFAVRVEGRAGRSVLQRAGSVSAVNNDALFPNDPKKFDDEALAVTELTFTQYFGNVIDVFGGLMNTAEGDANEIAGSALSNEHFMNSALLYSLVEDASVPNVSLGVGLDFYPAENVWGSLSVFNSEEAAGDDPFVHDDGTTLATEWTLEHELRGRGGAQTLGALYGIDARRTDIAADPRLVLISVLTGQPIPSTKSDTWAVYYNAHQFVGGDEGGGWGPFLRLGLSDGDPNLVRFNLAAGLGGTGLLPTRGDDRWGLGFFYLDMSEKDLLEGLGVENELGGETFYNIAATPWFHVTLDAQVVDSALPQAGTAWVLGIRTQLNL
jgi:porin